MNSAVNSVHRIMRGSKQSIADFNTNCQSDKKTSYPSDPNACTILLAKRNNQTMSNIRKIETRYIMQLVTVRIYIFSLGYLWILYSSANLSVFFCFQKEMNLCWTTKLSLAFIPHSYIAPFQYFLSYSWNAIRWFPSVQTTCCCSRLMFCENWFI